MLLDFSFKTRQTTSLAIVALAIVLGFTACDSGGSTGNGRNQQPNNSNPIDLRGVAQANRVVGGTVTVFKLVNGVKDVNLGEGGTSLGDPGRAPGSFEIFFENDPDYEGPVLVEVTGGTYVDEVTGQTVTLNGTLTAVVADTSGDPEIVVSPLTTLAASLARAASGGATAANITAANTQVAALFGGSFDLLATKPVDMTVMDTAMIDADVADYTLAIAAFSQLAADLALSPSQLLSQLERDIRDGRLDGRNGTTTVGAESSITKRLARALMTIQQSTNNNRGLTLQQATIDAVLASDGEIAGTALTGLDTIAPQVIEVFPSSRATMVSTSSRIYFRFSENVDSATVNNTTIVVMNGTTPVSGSVTYSAATRTATFTATGSLPSNATLSASAMTGIRDLAGNALATARNTTFETDGGGTGAAPALVSLTPAPGAANVGAADVFIATFDRPLDPAALQGAGTVNLQTGGNSVPVTVTYNVGATTFTVVPVSPLATGANYTLSINTSLLSATGVPLLTSVSRSFATAAMDPAVVPSVAATLPANNGEVGPNQPLVAIFSESMAPASAQGAVALFQGATPVAGTAVYSTSGGRVEFTPSAPLQRGQTYTFVIGSGAADLSGATLAGDVRVDFTVEAPSFTIVTPSLPDALTNQPYTQTISAIGGLNPVTFALAGGSLLPTGLTLDANGTLSGTPTASGMTSFTVQATDGAGLVATQSYTLNVVDMAVNASVSFAQPSQSTTDESTRTVSVALRLDAPSTTTSDTTVTVTLAATGTAIAGADFTFTTQSVTFPAGSSNGAIQSVPVGINADAIFEGDETVVLGLSGPGAGAGATHTLTITDDDAAPTLSFGAATRTAAETGGSVTLTATLSNPTTQAVSASFSVAGSANNPADHGLAPGSISIPATVQGAGNTTATITVPIVDDMLDEDDETIEVTLSSPTGATLGATPTVVITITDNDLPPTLSVADVTVTEGSSGTTMATFTVTQSAPSGRAVSVDIATADGSATAAGGDYAAGNATLTIAAGDTTADFTVAVTGDALSEDTETFSVSLTNAINASILNGTATGTITDDDAAPSLAIDSPSVTESDTGPTTLSFTVTMTGATGRDVTVDFATADGTALAGQDYTASSGSLTFTEGGAMTQTIDVTLLGDTIDEDDETFTVSLSNATNATIGTGTGTGTILDNENAPEASFAAGAVSVTEGVGTTGVSVSLSTPSARDVTVPFTVNPAGTALNPVDVSDIDMVNRQVRQYLSNNGSSAAAATVSALTPLTLNNTTLQSQAEYGIGNNEGVVIDVFGDLYQAGDVAGQPASIRVFKNVSDRSPSQGFDPVVDKIIVGPSTGLVAPKGLDVDSTAGLLFVADFGAGNIKVFSTGAVNDAAPLGTTTLTANPWDVDYDPSADRLYVALTDGTVAVFDSYVSGGFGATGADRTITPFDSGVQVSVNLHGIVHNAATDELYLSDVGAPSSPTDGQLFRITGAAAADGNVAVAAAIGGNLTNLGNPVDLAFDGEDLYVVEKSNNRILIYGDFASSTSGNIAANVEVLLPAGTGPESLAIDPGDRRDHTLVAGAVTIPAGQTSGTTNFTVDDDRRFENPETIIVELGTPTNAVLGAVTTQTITITDNDTVLPQVTIEDLTILEPNNGMSANALVVVRSDTAVGRAVTVDFATSDGSAVSTSGGDFTATSGTVTFAEGEVFGVIPVEIVGDNLNEVDETFTVTISNPTSAAIARTTATVTIQNNDNLPSLLIDSPTVSEAAGSVDFTVTLDAASGRTVTVDYATSGGTAVSGNDFNPTSGSLTFAPGGPLTQTITVPVSTDGLNEIDESFTMTLSNAVNALIPTSTGSATILDDDATAISIGDIALTEGDSGTAAATFTLSLSVMSEQTITVDFATAAGTATAGMDFTDLSQTVTIAAGTLSRQVAVDVAGDNLSEVNETFTASLANATGRGVSIATGSATATIMDDDPVTVTVTGTTVTEGTGGTVTATFAVSLSGPNGQAITVDFASADGSATAPSDYTAVGGTLNFGPGVSMQTVDVAVSSDTLNEVHEAFTVAISNATGNGVSIAPGGSVATGSITDDDDLTLSIADLTVTEGSSGTTTASLTVTLSGMSQQTPTVDFTTDNAATGFPASVGGDYTAASGTLSFAGGATTATIDVAVAADTAPERTEMFAVNLSNAVGRGISIADGAATVTITDDDDATVGFASATRTVNEDAGTVTYTIGSDGPKDQAITVPFTVNGSSTATNPTDFSDIDTPMLLPRVYVSNNGSANAGQIDALQILIGAGSFRNKAALAAGNNEGVVIDTNGNLYQAGDVSGDPASIRIVRNVSNLADGSAFEPTRDSLIVGAATGLAAPKGIDVATEAGLIFVADFGAGDVKVFRTSDTGNVAPSALVSTAANPWDLDFDATTNTLYVALTDGTVAVFPVTVTGTTVSIGALARTITPADGAGAKASTNLHGIVHDAVNDELYLSDVGSASVADDGRLFRITGAAAASGLTSVATDINHPTLGNPVDIAWDGANLYVAEKSNDRILVYTDFRTIMSGTVAANLERPQTKPESIALDPGTRRDHNLTAGTFTFQPGDTSASVSFTLVQDGRNEAAETLTVDLGTPTGPAVSGPVTSQTLNILDNNAQPQISIEDVTITETSGGMNTVATLRVTLDIASGRTVSVDYATTAGSAATPDDFTSNTGTLTFAEGEVTEFVEITIVGDDLNEAVETFTVSLSNELNAVIADGSATVTINDDDGVPTLSIDDVTLTEGDSGTQDAVFTVTLSAASGRPVAVNFAAQGGTAVAPEDYTSSAGMLSYAPGETTKTITVPVVGDAVNEAHESFTVELSAASNATIADGSGLATINDNDDITIALAGPGTITEGDGGTTAATFTLTLSGASRQLVMADFATTAGTATAGSDFTALSQTLTFSPGTTSRMVTVDVSADNLSEVNESFSAAISNPVGRGVTLGASAATVTIADDDPITISIANGSIIEGDAGTVTLSFMVSLSGPNGQSVTVDFATADDTAVAPGDYTAASGTLSFGPGTTTGMVDVTVAGDTLNELDEIFNVMLSNATGNGVSIASGMATATISDNDNITVSVGDVPVNEGSTGTVFANFPLTLSGPSEQSITVNYQTADASATAPGDYTAANDTLTFAPGQTAATVGVSVVGDTAAELDEAFVLSLTAASGRGVSIGTANGTATIKDDDIADIDFTTATSFLNEGAGTLTLTLNLSGPKGQPITVPILLNGSAGALSPDFSDLDTPTTIVRTYIALNDPAGATELNGMTGTSSTQEATYTTGNNEGVVIDTDGTLYQAGDVPGQAPSIRIFKRAAARGATASYDPLVDSIIRGSATTLVNPKGLDVDTNKGLIFVADFGANAIMVFKTSDVGNVAPTGSLTLATKPWDLDYDPTNDRLFVALVDGTVAVFDSYTTNFGAGGPTRVITPTDSMGAVISTNLHGIVYNAAADQLYLSDVGSASVADDGHLFLIDGAAAATGNTAVTLAIGAGTQGGTNTNAMLGNPVDIAFDGANLYVAEKSQNMVLVFTDFATRMSGDIAPDMSFARTRPESIALDPGTRRDTDFTGGSVTFAPGTTTATFTVNIISDGLSEGDETFTFSLGTVTGPGQAGATTPTSTVTVINDVNTSVPDVSIAGATVLETDAGVDTTARLMITLDEIAGRTVTVNYSTADGTAVAPGDYTTTSGTVTFAAGEALKFIDIPVKGDDDNEPAETFTVSLDTLVNCEPGTTTATVTITDNDGAPLIDITGGTTDEETMGTPGSIAFTVTLSRTSGQPVTVDFATASGSATQGSDFTAQSGTLTYAPGETSKTVTVAVLGDAVNEAPESFTVNLSNPTNSTINTGSATGSITDNDATVVTLAGPATAITETTGGSTAATFTVNLSVASEQTIAVNFSTTDGTATVADGDYTANNSTVTLTPGATSATATVLVTGDNKSELDETFMASIGGLAPTGTGVTLGAATSSTVTITDDDAITIAIVGATVKEDAGMANFDVKLSGANGQTVTVDFATADGTAVAGAMGAGDYDSQSGTLTFGPGVTTQTVSVVIIDEAVNEVDEAFSVSLSNPTGNLVSLDVNKSTVTGTITDNDTATINIADAAVTEVDNGATVTLNVPVTRIGASEQAISVNVSTAPVTATPGSDYDSVNSTFVIPASGADETLNVPVTIKGDNINEIDETFTVTITAVAGRGAVIGTATATATITENDPLPTLDISSATVSEDVGMVNLTVSLTGLSGRTVTVDVASAEGTATSSGDLDFTALPTTTLSFAPLETSKTVSIAVIDDTRNEITESFTASLSNVVGGMIGTATGTVTINDNDPLMVSINDRTVTEGDGASPAGDVAMTFTVSLDRVSEQTVTFDLATADLGIASARAGLDYTAVTQTVTFMAGSTTLSQPVTVTILPDAINEAAETFNVNLSNLMFTNGMNPPAAPTDGSGFARAQGTGSIFDEDPLTITIADSSVTEGDATNVNMPFTVTTDIQSEQNIVLSYSSAAGTAALGADFTAASGQLVINPGSMTASFNVSVVGERINEANETFTTSIALVGQPNLVTITDNTATGTILDNDDLTVTIFQPAGPVAEGSNADFRIRLSIATEQSFTVRARAEELTASQNQDFAATETDFESLTSFTPVLGVPQAIFSVPVNNDDLYETDQLFIGRIFAPSPLPRGVTINSLGSQANATIVDTDALTITLTGPATVAESVGSAVYTARLDGVGAQGTLRLEQEVAVTYRTAEGTATYATPTNDLEDTTSLVTFPAGSMSAGMVSRTFGVVVIDDNINEATESFSVNFVGVAPTPRITNNTMSVTTNITDNDTATLTIDDVTVTEGTFGEPTIASFTITTDTRSQGVLSVTGTTLDGTAQAGGLGGGGRTIRTIAGNGTAGFAGDGGQGASAQINNPADTVIDPANGRVYFIDASNQRIRVINVQSGTIATVAGTGVSGFQNGAGFQATFRFNTQSRMVLAPDGSSLIFTDTNNHAVRRFNLTSGEVTTVVNTAGAAGFAGDGGLAPAARLNNPTGLAFDPSGQLYIADAGNRRIRRVLTDSTIETFAGTGGAGDNTDNVPRLTATFDSLRGMAFGNGFLYVCEFLNDRVYRISSTTVTRFVGIGTDGFNGDGLAPGVTQLVDPEDVVVLRNGDVAIADVGQNRVRLVDVSANVVSTIVGNGTATPYTGDLTNLAAESQVDPRGLALAPSGELYVTDISNDRVFRIGGGFFDDFVGKQAVASIPAFTSTTTFTVEVVQDNINERTETYSVQLTGPMSDAMGGAVVLGAASTGTGTILDDDPIFLNVRDLTMLEGTAGAGPPPGAAPLTPFNVQVELRNTFDTIPMVSQQPISFIGTTSDGTAMGDANQPLDLLDDYAARLGDTETFQPGSPRLSFIVQINADDLNEPVVAPVIGETFFVTLSNQTRNDGMGNVTVPDVTIDDQQATVTIIDDDIILISIDDITVTEGTDVIAPNNFGTTDFTFTLSLNITNQQRVRVQLDTMNGTIAGREAYAIGQGSFFGETDYTARAGATVTFPPTITTAQFTVSVSADNYNEPDEIFTVPLSNPQFEQGGMFVTNTSAVDIDMTGGRNVGTATILDDDNLVITIANTTLMEGDNAGDTPAVSPSNFAAFTPNYTNNAAFSVTFNIPSEGDMRWDTTFSNGGVMGVGTATSIEPGGPGQGDYDNTPINNFTVAPGVTSTTLNVPVAADDVNEVNEAFTAMFNNLRRDDLRGAPTNFQPDANLTGGMFTITTSATATIMDDDNFVLTVSDDDADNNLAEATADVVTLSYAILGGTSTATNTQQSFDYNLFHVAGTPTTATFPGPNADYTRAGPVSFSTNNVGTMTFPHTVINDAVNEATESFLTRATRAGTPRGITVMNLDSETFSILDNDLVLFVVGGPGSVAEGATATYTVTRVAGAGATEQTFTVVLNTTDGTARAPEDFAALNNAVVIPASGTPGNPAPIPVSGAQSSGIVDDAINEPDQSFTVTQSFGAGSMTNNLALVNNPVTTTIMANDPITFDIAGAPANVAEGSSLTLSFTTTGPTMTQQNFTLNLVTGQVGDTATESPNANSDYTSQDGTLINVTTASPTNTVTFMNPANVMVPVTDDMTNEANETFSSLLNLATGATNINLGGTTVTTTIPANDPIMFTLTAGAVSINEGDSSMYTVGLGAGSATSTEQTFDLNFSTGAGGDTARSTAPADYNAVNNTVLSATGTPGNPFSIPNPTVASPAVTTIDDTNINEGNQTFTSQLSLAGGTQMVTVGPAASVIINANDLLTYTVSGPGTTTEGGTATFTLTQTNAAVTMTEQSFTLSFLTGFAGDTAVEGADYISGDAAVLNSPGSPTTAFTLPALANRNISITDDNINEGNEVFGSNIQVTAGAPLQVAAPVAPTNTTITANDPLNFTIMGPATVTEGATAMFTITETNGRTQTQQPFSLSLAVNPQTTGPTTSTTADFNVAGAGSLINASGAGPGMTVTFSNSFMASVTAVDDTINEPDQDFISSLNLMTMAGNIMAGTGMITTTISANDPVNYNANTVAAVNEVAGPAGTAMFTLTTGGAGLTEQAYSISFVTNLGGTDTATKGTDYPNVDAVVGTFTGTPTVPVSTSLTITTRSISVAVDGINEGDEVFTRDLTAMGAPQQVGLPVSDSTTINANDPITFTVMPSAASIAEGGSVVFTVGISGPTMTEQAFSVSFATASGAAPVATESPAANFDFNSADAALFSSTGAPGMPFDVSAALAASPGGGAMRTVTTVDDAVNESNENLTGEVVAAGAGNVMGSGTSQVVINASDPINVSLMATATNVNEGSNAQFMIGLTGATMTEQTFQLDLATGTVADTAAEGVDYTSGDGMAFLSVAGTPGSPATLGAPATINVPTTDDNLNEATQTFANSVVFSGTPPAQVTLPAMGSVTISIADQDPVGLSSLSVDNPLIDENGAPNVATFTIELTGAPGVTLESPLGVTATQTAGTPSRISFPSALSIAATTPVGATFSFAVTGVDDGLPQGLETFTVQLTTTDPTRDGPGVQAANPTAMIQD